MEKITINEIDRQINKLKDERINLLIEYEGMRYCSECLKKEAKILEKIEALVSKRKQLMSIDISALKEVKDGV